jgi:hypothetical protein
MQLRSSAFPDVLGMPLLADFLDEGLSQFGISCDD